MKDSSAAGCAVMGVIAAIVVVIVSIFGFVAGGKAFGRYQAVQDARNKAHVARINAENEQHVNELRIAAQAQKVRISQQDAQIRYEQAKGVRMAQDEISRTLTPLYVQMEMVESLREIAKSGKNNTVIYLPSKDGLPVTAQAGAGK